MDQAAWGNPRIPTIYSKWIKTVQNLFFHQLQSRKSGGKLQLSHGFRSIQSG